MTDHRFEIMPDRLAALELELRARAAAPSARRTSPRQPLIRRPALAAVFACLVLATVLVSPGSLGGGTRAFGRLPILDTPAMLIARNVPPDPSRGHFGRDPIMEARPINAHRGAFLLTGSQAWCLSISTPGGRPEEPNVGMTCMPTAAFFRFGISIRIGDFYLAIVLPDAPLPTFTRNGTTVTLQPDAQGVITVPDFHSGDTITMYSPDGKARPDHAA